MSQAHQQQQPLSTTSSSSSCWECLRREVACDATHPACRICIDKGLVCPGYENRKPLRWLVPGTVTAWPRKRKKQQDKKKEQKLAIRGAIVPPGQKGQPSNELAAAQVRGEEKGSTSTLVVYTPAALYRTVLTLELDYTLQCIQYCEYLNLFLKLTSSVLSVPICAQEHNSVTLLCKANTYLFIHGTPQGTRSPSHSTKQPTTSRSTLG